MPKLPITDKSFWRDAYNEPKYPLLTGELKVDVAIVGAGIVGLSAAYF